MKTTSGGDVPQAAKRTADGNPVALPAGPPPLRTLPRYRVPDSSSKSGFRDRPDLVQLQAAYGPMIAAAMRHPVNDHQFNKVFDFQKRFFFVARDFPYLRAAIKPAHESFAASVDVFSRPSKNEVEALFEREAVSLPGLIRLALAFEAAIQHNNRSSITYFGLNEGNPLSPANGKLIVPALRSVDPQRIREVRLVVRGSDDGFSNYAVRSGRAHIARSFFTAYLELGVIAGKKGARQGNYLLTEPCAKLVHSYLKDCYDQMPYSASPPSKSDWWRDRSVFPSLDQLFPNDPDHFPGAGLYCKPLPVRYGNVLE